MSNTRFPNEIVRASAGTGKTFQLSNRYLELIVRGVDGPSILATTFTRKAAGEILDRIVQRLSAAALDENVANDLGEFIGLPNLPTRRCREILAETLGQIHRLQISTLDSFFSKLATGFSLELGMFGDWRVINETDYEYQMLCDEAIERILQDGKVTEVVYMLTQGEAIRGISKLIRDAVRNLYRIFLDSPPEAWQKIPRFELLSDEEVVAAIDRLRELVYPSKRIADAIEVDLQKYIKEDYKGLLKAGIAKKVLAGETTYHRKELPPESVTLMKRLVDNIGNSVMNQISIQTEANYKVLELFHEAFTRLKAERGVVQYDDIARGLAHFVATASAGKLNYRLDHRINHLLLDEFQDTAPIQWNVIRPFAQRVTESKQIDTLSESRSFYCVGDTKQAIYRWRGGEAKIFDTVDEQLENVDEATPLTHSFRSSPVVIDAVNLLFQKMPNHPVLGRHESAVESWCSRFLDHSTQRTDLPGHVKLEIANDKDKMLTFVADRVVEQVRNTPSKSIGILVRKNITVSNLIGLLGDRGIIASEEGGNPLLDSAAVRVILSALRLADHPAHRVAWFHLQNSPLAKLFRFVNAAGEAVPYNARKVNKLAADIRARLLHEGYGPVIQRWADEIKSACTSREQNRLQQCVDLAFKAQHEITLRPTDFVSYIESTRVSDPSAAQVRVMNVHQAKGLEFDIVVLPELDQQLITQTPSWVSLRRSPAEPIETVSRYINQDIQPLIPDHLQDVFKQYETQAIGDVLCWMYVALTRARQAMHLYIARNEREKMLPRSVSGLIRAALAPGEKISEPKILFESGDPNWYQQSPKEVKTTSQANSIFRAATPIKADQKIRLAKSTNRLDRGLQIFNPSDLESGEVVRIFDVLKSSENSVAIQRGNLIHRFFQEIIWLDDTTTAHLSNENLSRIAAEFKTFDLPIAATIDQFQEMIRRPVIEQLLSQEYYSDLVSSGFDSELETDIAGQAKTVSVFNEHEFAVRTPEGIVHGKIDRLVLVSVNEEIIAADIIDFKTDAFDATDENQLQEKTEFYRPQLRAYANAIERIYNLPSGRVRAKLAFVHSGFVVEVSGLKTSATTHRAEVQHKPSRPKSLTRRKQATN